MTPSMRAARIAADKRVDEEIELEAHFVAEFDLDVAVAAREEAWRAIDHDAPAWDR